MSSGTRTTGKGGKGAKADKLHKTDKSDIGKATSDKQQTSNTNSKHEEHSIKEKVNILIEMSQKTEEEVCLALHEADNDVQQAMEMLLENQATGEWETTVKKKKSKQSGNKQDKTDETVENEGWGDEPVPISGGGGGGSGDKERPSRNRSGGPPRLHSRHSDNRGWRGRERGDNDRTDRNFEEGGRDFNRERRGRGGGSRGGGGARGRGGGRAGGRYPPRGDRGGNRGDRGDRDRGSSYNKQATIDTWDNSNTWDTTDTWDNNTAVTTNHTTEENWVDFPASDEWSTEEYTGSLADTKVFTPSVQPGLNTITEPPSVNQSAAAVVDPTSMGQTLQMTAQQQQTVQMPSQSPVPIVGTLSAAQTQYLTQLTQQNSDSMNKQYAAGGGVPAAATQTYQTQPTYDKTTTAQQQVYANAQQYAPSNAYVNTTYPVNTYGTTQEQQATQQPVRTKTQRARVPPPSKIPSSAVEMPGELNSSISYLDVQFGALDMMDGNSFDSVSEAKYGNAAGTNLDSSNASTSMDLNSAANANPSLDAYSPKTQPQSSISSALSQGLSNTENIPQQTSDHITTASYNTTPRSTSQQQQQQQQASVATQQTTSAVAASGMELNKQSDSHTYSQPSSYNSYQPKSNAYNVSTYSGTQTTNSYVSNNQGSYSNQSATYIPSSASSYQTYSSTASSYQPNSNANAYPSISQANSYQNNQTYPQHTSQSVYGANTGLNNSSSYGNTSTSQYNSYSSTNSHKLKENSYDSTSNAVSSSSQATTTSNVTSSTAALTISQTTVSSSKTTTTSAAKNSSSSVVSNIPTGVAPVMSTPYILGQVPYFQQPAVYTYEEMQMMQQRLPHMTNPYYDMGYQTPTTMATVRDGSLSNVGYGLSDARFTRGDNNASPVPSTLSQQTSTLTQGHQAQPILAGGAPPYFFATAFNTIAPNYQFGTMYTQLPAATNAHGTNNSNQYPKPGTYGSGYGGYDTLSQTQDYTKGGYANAQSQKGTGGNASTTGTTGTDLTSMYGKSHAALGKVNSYEKQGFHSGTPPPFTGALHGSQNAGLAPSGTGYAPQVYIPTMPPHQQHHSTALMHQPHLQMDVRHQGRRVESGNTSGQRSQASNQAKASAKQPYQSSYWNQA